MDGDYCCKYDVEHVEAGNEKPECDGGKISMASLCCKDHQHIKCPHKLGCVNHAESEGNSCRYTKIEIIHQRPLTKYLIIKQSN